MALRSTFSSSISPMPPRHKPLHRQTRLTAQTAPEEGRFQRPPWSGETHLSCFVRALISFKPLYTVLRVAARQVMIIMAERANVPWKGMRKEILEKDLSNEFNQVHNPNLLYPHYYLSPFHCYDEGNLSWLAAAEAEVATLSIAKMTIPDASTAIEAVKKIRESWLRAIEKHIIQYSDIKYVQDILDIGCSVGISTHFLATRFPAAKVVGLDLSPYFLAVAQHKEKQRTTDGNQITWIHANAEETGLPSNSFDIVSIAYMFHECPTKAIKNVLREAYRLLRPGGTLAITDKSPKSKVYQELTPIVFTLAKCAEPFIDEYYLLDLEEAMREIGFIHVTSVFTDPRARTLTATV